MKKRILSLLLALVMLLGMLPTVALAAENETPTSGRCGENVTWSYDADTQTLTISGSGATYDYGSKVAKAPPYADSSVYPIKHFVVDEGITKIGKYVLYSYVNSAAANTTVLDIKLPESLTEVSTYAIYKNAALKSITFPKNVTSFSATGSTISGCTALEEIIFEGKVEEIGQVYRNCSALKSAVIPAGTIAIASSAFSGCKALEELTIPESVTSIGSSAFSGCTGIKNLTIPTTVKEIGSKAFYNWNNTQAVNFGYKITEVQEKIQLDADWDGGSNASFNFLPLDSSYCEDISIAMKSGDETYPGTLSLNDLAISFKQEVDIMAAPTFTNPEIVVTKDGQPWTTGTATLSSELTFTSKGNGVYATDTKLTLAPTTGTAGDAIPLTISFKVTERTYEFAGAGTEENPYVVDSALALYHLSKKVNSATNYTGKFFKQTKDIDMSGMDWTPIGITSKRGQPDNSKSFKGTYDGGNFRIKNLVVDKTDTYAVGLFGSVKGGTVKNVIIDKSCSFRAGAYVAGVIGAARDTQIGNCSNEAAVYATGSVKDVYSSGAYAAGIVGYSDYKVDIIDCVNYGDITLASGAVSVGGIAGESPQRIINCHNYGDVFGGRYVGGVTATLNKTTMIGCSNHGAIRSSYSTSSKATTLDQAVGSTGGLSGWIMEGSIVESCYNTGTVTVDWPGAGGLFGTVGSGVMVANSYTTGKVISTYTGEWDTAAGAVFGHVKPMLNSVHTFENLFYLEQGMAAIGANEATDVFTLPEGKTSSAMKGEAFLRKLQNYSTQELTAAVWAADSENVSGGYPIITGTTDRLDYHKQLTEFTVGNLKMTIDEAAGTVTGQLTNDVDMTTVTPTLKISANATVSPASGEAVDFSKGAVQYTVTAQDGTTKVYTVTLTKVENAKGLMTFQLQGDYANSNADKKLLLPAADFDQNTLTYKIDCRDGVIDTQLDAWPIPALQGSTVQVAINGNTPENLRTVSGLTGSGQFIRSFDVLHQGENTLVFTVTPPEGSNGETVSYTVTLNIRPSLHSMSLSGTGVKADPSGYWQNQSITDYTLTLAPNVENVNVSFTTYGAPDSTIVTGPTEFTSSEKNPRSHQYQYTGTVPVDQTMDKFTIKVACADESIPSTDYTFHLVWQTGYTAKVETKVDTANIRLFDPDGTLQAPGEGGVYTLTNGKTYSYVVAAKGYKSQTGTIAGPSDLTDGKLTLTLEAVAPNTLKKFDALWPSFRGNDNNMAITAAKTRTSDEATGLLWSTSAGSGYNTGAVGSPIIVGGYLYAYSGTNILKIDKATGEIVKKGDMVATSDFAIVPPTYAEGMIFVGLSKGRVQAFNAETLESLWVYTDPRGGQSNSPITYSDGCVYTGFWNGEAKTANFVCLTIDDEDPTATTEAKQALWTYTQLGGFYWAGAYAHGDYVVVGTDDGQSGYTSATANLLVFNKTSGEVVDSKTGYVGDIRSNVAYDADTDRVYFTSKGGHFYSEQIDWSTGKIKPNASKDINLGGMSTSTPVVYNGRAYVGVSGLGQFTAGSGHHIAVLDLDNWQVAYTANTKGYPQTSGLLSTAYEAETGYVYVYFMDNYTPGALRVIKDQKGQTALLDGVTEDQVDANGTVTTVENCAPIVFEPKGELAQYCICSPIADENGVIYFKNDTGNMMAVGHTTDFQGWTVTFNANGGTIATTNQYVANKLSNKLEKMPTARRDGYTLLGWFTEQDGGERVTLDTVYTKDTIVYARWEKAADPERKDSVTVYFSISNDGEYLQSSITGQTLAQLPVTLEYFDLKEYDLEDFYRTGSDGKAIIHPTLLHLLIKMLEDQYLDDTLEPGESVNTKLQYGNNESDEPYKALKITGSATSMYMTNFWGHDENLLYYVNHQYPLMYEGWGSTADWILLEDGDAIEVAMFTDWDFIHNEEAGFPYFRQGKAILDDLTLAADEQQTLTVARATADASGKHGEKLNPNTKIYYTTNLNRVSGDVTTWTELGTTDASGSITVSFDAAGTYYIAVPGSSVRAPGICKVTVVADAAVAAAASKINAIGPVDETSGDKIKTAREALDALTSEQQAQIPEATRNKLIEAEKAYQAILDQKATNEAIQKINAIGEVTKDSGAAIKAARDAYDALTDEQKALVPADKLKKLTDAEAKYADLTKPVTPVTPATPSTPAQNPFNPNAGETLPFADVNANSWYYSGVKYAYKNGLMNGTGTGKFSPNADTTRGMIVTMLARLEGVSTSGTPWYAAGQKWAMDAGISDGTNMTGAITREQLAAILFRYAKQKGYDVSRSVELNGFVDAAQVSNYATEAMQWAVANGLIQGSNNKLSPKATASRAQVATILMRFMALYAN